MQACQHSTRRVRSWKLAADGSPAGVLVWLTRHLQCSNYWINNSGADLDSRIDLADRIAKNVSRYRDITKHTSNHGQWYSSCGGRENLANHNARKLCQFLASLPKDLPRLFISGTGGRHHGWQQRREIGSRVRGASQIFD